MPPIATVRGISANWRKVPKAIKRVVYLRSLILKFDDLGEYAERAHHASMELDFALRLFIVAFALSYFLAAAFGFGRRPKSCRVAATKDLWLDRNLPTDFHDRFRW
jgi:hypothetical protein